MKKLGKGNNIEEILQRHLDKVLFVQKQNEEILDYCRKIDKNFSKTISKVGIVRYSAFRDTGSDLSFTLALLNKENDGVVLNGIYSREMSNIYAKPIKNGESTYTLSKEETTRLAQRQLKFIQGLQAALVRIENKTYGICRETGKLIPAERLRAVPHATLSIEAKNSGKK